MLKKMMITFLLSVSSSLSFASDCLVSDLKTYKHENEIQPRWDLSVISKHRVYFHSAPKVICKMEDDYIIRNDRVIAYSMYTDKAKEKWDFGMFTNKEHAPDDGDDLVEGWVKFKNFKKLDNYASVTE